MSQEKVNRYKEEKMNRKLMLQKQRRNRLLSRIIIIVVGLALAGWIGFSIHDSIARSIAAAQTEVNMDAIQDYLSGLDSETAEEE